MKETRELKVWRASGGQIGTEKHQVLFGIEDLSYSDIVKTVRENKERIRARIPASVERKRSEAAVPTVDGQYENQLSVQIMQPENTRTVEDSHAHEAIIHASNAAAAEENMEIHTDKNSDNLAVSLLKEKLEESSD